MKHLEGSAMRVGRHRMDRHLAIPRRVGSFGRSPVASMRRR
jgi:hypothetical protein